MSELHETLKSVLQLRWPARETIVLTALPRSVFVISEPLVIDFGEFVDGAGNYYDTRGEGPVILADGVTIIPDPHVDWTGKAVVEICGTSTSIEGLRIDTRGHQNPPALGIVYGSVKRKAGTGHSYSGGQSVLSRVTCIGPFTVAGVGFINGEMVTLRDCNIVNEHRQGGHAVMLSHGTTKELNLVSRITLEGYTQTRVTVENSRISNRGSAPLLLIEGNVGQLAFEKNIFQSDSGAVFRHTGSLAQQLTFRDNRWESWHGSYMGSFEKAPANCLFEGNYLTRHGQLQPTFAVVVCPEDIKAVNARFVRNAARKPLTNSRKTYPLEVTPA